MRALSALVVVALVGTEGRAETVVLPLSGLAVDAPRGLHVTARYSLEADGYIGYDRVDERDARGELVASTWIAVDWFDAFDCPDLLRGAAMFDAWERPALKLWGATFSARGGVVAPPGGGDDIAAVMLCFDRSPRKPLVVLHGWPAERERRADRLIARLRRSRLVVAIQRAYRQDHTATVTPTRSPLVVRVGSEREATLRLPGAGLLIDAPDDGFVWQQTVTLDGIDRFDRMAPALPERTVEVARIDSGASCADAFRLIGEGSSTLRPTNVPPGWEPGPTFDQAGVLSASLCRLRGSGDMLFAIAVSATRGLDLTDLAPLFAALASARERVPETPPPRPLPGTTAGLR